MRKLLAKELKIKFIEAMSEVEHFSYEDGNPFLISIEEKEFIVFLKNLSSAYFKRSKDITRIQLPFSNHFKNLSKKIGATFLALGYDIDNNIFVCWNPTNVIGRLNAKNNVSLYSRKSLQMTVSDDTLKVSYLSNGEKIVLFKRSLLIEFFRQVDDVFNTNMPSTIDKVINIKETPTSISVIKDDAILLQILPLLKKNKVLESVEICINHYKQIYPEMSFRDWFDIVKDIYNDQVK